MSSESPLKDISPDSGINELCALSPDEQERQKQEWANELAKLEEEINTLKHVLSCKIKTAQDLKRKLGFSVWREFQDDMSQGLKNVKESHVFTTVEEKVGQFGQAVVNAPIYQKTESLVKATTEKTTSILGGLGSGLTHKIGQLKNSDSYRSFEEKMGSAYENVKGRVTPRSTSAQSFMEILREGDQSRSQSVVSSPIAEEKHVAT